ncbi:MAG: cell division protein ZapE [Parahaliea sp.]
MPSLSPAQAYHCAQNQDGFVADHSQGRAVAVLESCYRNLHTDASRTCTGVYLWGPVGRGKTWLMDMFHQGLQLPSRRQHFHNFMQWVHRRLFALTGTVDPLRELAAELARELRVLCFDELSVSDIGDAMLLGRLFQAMFEAGIVMVATSNQPPEQLYAGGFNRQRFLPAIGALQWHMRVVEVDGGMDHRLRAGDACQRYWVRDRQILQRVFSRLSDNLPVTEGTLVLGGRRLSVKGYSAAAIWLRFADLCGQPFSALDFIALCDRFPNILLAEVPALSARQRPAGIARGTEDGVERVAAGERELPALSVTDDSVRRFIALVDECYDRKVPLYVEAAVPLPMLYTEGHLLFPFRRTFSRLSGPLLPAGARR